MASFKIAVQPAAERELREAPFPFRRQLVQAIHKLKIAPRPPDCERIDAEFYRLPVHGWRLVYGVDDDAQTVTIYRVTR